MMRRFRCSHVLSVAILFATLAGCGGSMQTGGGGGAEPGTISTARSGDAECRIVFRAPLSAVALPGGAATRGVGGVGWFGLTVGPSGQAEASYSGSLDVPDLDVEAYDEIVAQLLRRIPTHTPEWTDHNESDPGQTSAHNPEWTNHNESDPGQASTGTFRYAARAAIRADLVRQLWERPEDYILALEARGPRGSAVFVGGLSPDPGQATEQGRAALRDCLAR